MVIKLKHLNFMCMYKMYAQRYITSSEKKNLQVHVIKNVIIKWAFSRFFFCGDLNCSTVYLATKKEVYVVQHTVKVMNPE